MEGIGLILIFFGVIALTVVLFITWVIFSIVRLTIRGILALVTPTPQARQSAQRDAERMRAFRSDNGPSPGRGGAGIGTAAGWRIGTGRDFAPCRNPRCQLANPIDARFCRRCGNVLTRTQRATPRRVAMF